MFEIKGENKMLLSASAILCCLATPDDKNITVATYFDKCQKFRHISDAEKNINIRRYAYALLQRRMSIRQMNSL